VAGEGKGIFDAGIATADDQNGFVAVFVRVVQLVLHAREIFAGNPQFPDVALETDGEYHAFGIQCVTVFQRDVKVTTLAGDRRYIRIRADMGAMCGEFLLPCLQNIFPGAGIKSQGAAQGQPGRLGHHQLALLEAVNGVGEVWRAFEKNVRHAQRGRVCGGRQPRGPRADDGDPVPFPHRQQAGMTLSIMSVPTGRRPRKLPVVRQSL